MSRALLSHSSADIDGDALGDLLVMKGDFDEHIIMATVKDHKALIEPHYCTDPLLVTVKSSPQECYMPDRLFCGLAHRLSEVKNWDRKAYSSSYFQYHYGDGIFIYVTSREYFLEIGIRQSAINSEVSSPEHLHEKCSEIRQTVTEELFTVVNQLSGVSPSCKDEADKCACSVHKRFHKHYPVGFPCSH